ncbi:MAG: RNA polymerase sigma factor [Candidatus Aminicenantales bacterium]
MVELILNGQTEAFEPLVTPYRKLLLTLAYRLSRNAEEAKEISQETLLRAFRYLRSFDRRRSFKNWLLQIEMNVWRATSKKGADEATLRQLAASHHPENPEAKQAGDEVRRQLLSCLDGLSPRETEVFLLRDIEGMSIKETAGTLRTSAISVRVHLSRAREKIRERVKERYPELLEGKR